MAKVTSVVYSDITFDNRVLRQAASLSHAGHDVKIVCAYPVRRRLHELPLAIEVDVEPPVSTATLPARHNPLRSRTSTDIKDWRDVLAVTSSAARGLMWATRYLLDLYRWGARVKKRFPETEVWHAHDLTALMALADWRGQFRGDVVYDSHELFVESGSAARLPAQARRMLRAYEGMLARRASAVITVNDAIRDAFAARYRVNPAVVMNCPPIPGADRRGVMRELLGLGSRPVVLYHGSLAPGRGIEAFLHALPLLPRDIVFVVIGEGPLAGWLDVEAAKLGVRERVWLHPMVVPDDLHSWIKDASVGTVLFDRSEGNHLVASPNKLFEYMASGVPVLASDLPAMRAILEDARAGVVCDSRSPADVAATTLRLLEPETAAELRRNAQEAAVRRYNWAVQSRVLLDTYRRLGARSAI